MTKPTVLITGASSGIGSVYADRFAKRGHPLTLVARNRDRLESLAARLRQETGVQVAVLRADLTVEADVAAVEARLREDASTGVLVNNAGAASDGGFAQGDLDALNKLVALNVVAVSRLAAVAARAFAQRGGGAIVNVGSVVGFSPERMPGVYGATKAFVLALSKSLTVEMAEKGVYTQAVLPSATSTEIWERAGYKRGPSDMMSTEDLVDAALVGFDRRETITIPSLQDPALWDRFEAARVAMLPSLRQPHVGARYRARGVFRRRT